MEAPPQSALYPETETTFSAYVVYENGHWLDYCLACKIDNPNARVFNYSNINSFLIGVVLTEVLGCDLGEFIKKIIRFRVEEIIVNNKSFDAQRIAEGYAKRPWLHKGVMKQIQDDCNIRNEEKGLDVGCGAGLSTKALRLLCNHVTGTDISPEMIAMCNKLYDDDSYNFYVAKAEETEVPEIPYDIITAAGVVNWVDREQFLSNADKVLKTNGLIVVYDFWITDKMVQKEEYTKWYQEQYLVKFPKPYRKENVWQQTDLTEPFTIEKQTKYNLQYVFEIDEFVDFMMIQSNVNEAIENGNISVQEARDWMRKGLQEMFKNEKRTLVFEGYNWYIRKH